MQCELDRLSGTKGRSSKYIALHKAIEEAAELKYKNLTPEKAAERKAEKIRGQM